MVISTGALAEKGLRLDGDDLRHRVGVVGEVEAVAGTDLDHAAGEPFEQLLAVLALAAILELPGGVVERAGKDRMRDALRGGRHGRSPHPREPLPACPLDPFGISRTRSPGA